MYYAKKLWAAGVGVVYNFVPFVAPESFNDPRKYADYGLTVNLYEKFRVYKMTWAGADIAVEFSDAIASFNIPTNQLLDTTIEVFETVSGVETSSIYSNYGFTHYFTSGSNKRYMIRRITSSNEFILPVGSVWAYCSDINTLEAGASTYLKYIFFYENTLTEIGTFRNTTITGTLTINGGVTNIPSLTFWKCNNLTKVITGNTVQTIVGGNTLGAFYQCTGLIEADLGTGMTSIGQDTFRDCTSLATIICRAETPPTIIWSTFRNIPDTTIFKVPAASLSAYKTATNWSLYASRIYAI